MKGTFLRKDGFLQKFECTAVREQITYYLINILFNEGKEDSYYSIPTLGNSWTYFKQGLGYKVLQSIMTTSVTLVLLSAEDNYFFFNVTGVDYEIN